MDQMTKDELVQLLKKNGFEPMRNGVWRTKDAIADWLESGRPLLFAPPEGAPPVEDVTRVVPDAWLDKGLPVRIITHWTAGAYLVSELDKEHYHFIVDGDGKVFRGDHTVADNDVTGDNDYAAHTLGTNTKSIGVAVACMAGAVERPFKPGKYPMKREQWLMMARVVAELCQHYAIAVTPKTVLGHGEVQAILGKPQRGKWDPMVLPWEPATPAAVVGNMFRAEVQRVLETLK